MTHERGETMRLRLATAALREIVATGILADDHVIQAQRALELVEHASDEELAALLAVHA